jgi:AraC-like DNA-binding protein
MIPLYWYFSWVIHHSGRALPEIDRAGRFALANPTLDFCYRGPTHVLHLYEYDAVANVDGERLPLRAGDVTCIAAGSIYAFQAENPGNHWCIHFRDVLAADDPGFTLPTHLPLRLHGSHIAEQFRLISRLHNDPGRGPLRQCLLRCEAQARLKALLFQLSSLHHIPPTGRKPLDSIDWDALSKLMDEGLDGHLTSPGLAARMGVNPAAFDRSFKQRHGCTIKQYLLGRRIARAESLLATTTLRVQEIGAAVGITDPQYFNKQFRRVTGFSPSRYRQENRHLLAQQPPQLTTRDGGWRSNGKLNAIP